MMFILSIELSALGGVAAIFNPAIWLLCVPISSHLPVAL
jgi:hypothetical protein